MSSDKFREIVKDLASFRGRRTLLGLPDEIERLIERAHDAMPHEEYDRTRFCGPPSFCACAKAMKARGDDITSPRSSTGESK